MNFDWIDVLLANPDKDAEYLEAAGLNENNVNLKDKNFYKDNQGVRDFFTDEKTGEFNENAFNTFYDNATKSYTNYMQNLQDQKALTVDLDFFKNRNKLDGSIYIKKVPNPTGSKIGIDGVNRYTKGDISMREAAQNNWVRDPYTGQSLGWKPNDDDRRGLLDFLFQKPVVEARWEEDGIHLDPMTGQQVRHNKGDWKLDENGNPYYEDLADRDGTGKNYLHQEDTLTVDGTFWNKFDPFDSDGVSKNIDGQIMKTAAYIAPLLIPGVNMYYGAAMSGVLLSSALSSLAKAGVEAVDSNYQNNSLWRGLNNYSAYMNRFEKSVSDEGSESMLNFEQATNLLSDVVSQLYQQRAVAYIPKLLKWDKASSKEIQKFLNQNGDKYLSKYGKTIQKAVEDGDAEAIEFLTKSSIASHWNRMNDMNKRASDMSKLYMVLTQTSGVYDTFKENNFDETSTAIGLLGTALGFHKLFNSSLGDLALSGLGLDEMSSLVKKVVKDMAKKNTAALGELGTIGVTEEAAKKTALSRVKGWADEFTSKFKDLLAGGNIKSSMLKEGIEEVSEEVNQDVMLYGASQLENALDTLGWGKKTNTYEYLKTNPFERYLMSALGGAVGGAIFPMMTKWENFAANGFKVVDKMPEDDIINLVKILEKTPIDKVETVIKGMLDKGAFGSTVLSANPIEDGKGGFTFGKAANPDESQNYVIGQNILAAVRAIDSVLKSEAPNLSGDEIINSALGRQLRAQLLIKDGGMAKLIADDFNNVVSKVVKAKAKISSLADGEQPSETDKQIYNDAKQELNDLLSGKRAGEYTEKLAFLLSPNINAPFLDSTVQLFTMQFGKNYNTLNESERKKIDDLFKAYTSDDTDKKNAAFKLFKYFRDLTEPELKSISNESGNDVFKFRKQVQKELEDLKNSIIDKTISKEELDEKEQLIKTEFNNLDDFISSYNLDPEGLLNNEEDKKKVVERHWQTALNTWKTNEASKRLLTNMGSHLGVGFDNVLSLVDNDDLMKFANIVAKIAANQQYIDSVTMDSLNSIYGMFNNLDINHQIDNGDSSNIVNAVMAAIEGDEQNGIKGKRIAVDSNLATDGVVPDDIIVIDKSDSHYGNSQEYAEGFEYYNRDVIKELITKTITANSESTNKLYGGVLDDSGEFKGDSDRIREIASNVDESDVVPLSQLINDYFQSLKNPELDNLYKTIQGLNEKVTSNPIWNMLTKLSNEIIGEDIFNIMKRENSRLGSLDRLADYVLDDDLTQSQLSDMLSIIQVAKSLVAYHSRPQNNFDPTGTNFSMLDLINEGRRISGEEPLFSYNEDDAKVILGDLDNLAKSIDLLFIISNANNVSKIKDNTITMTRCEGLLLNIFSNTQTNKNIFSIDGNEAIVLPDLKDNFFNFSIEEHKEKIKSILENKSDSIEDLKFIDKLYTDMQHYYYERFKNLTDSDKETLLNILTTIPTRDTNVGIDYSYNINTKISRNMTALDFSPEHIAKMAISMFVTDQSAVKSDFLKVLNQSNTPYAPFFGQFLDVQMAMALVEDSNNLINTFLEKIRTNNPTNDRIQQQGITFNAVGINGDPGSGKTTGVAYFIKEIIKLRHSNAKITAAAPKDFQAEKFGNLLDIEEYKNKSELFDKFLTPEGIELKNKIVQAYEHPVQGDNNKFTFEQYGDNRKQLNQIDPKYFKSSEDPQIIFIDEYTHFATYEIRILAQIPNVKIIMLGDIKQEGHPISSAKVGIMFDTPNLNMSVRANNGYKKDNLDIVSNLLKDSQERINVASFSNKVVDLRDVAKKFRDEIALRYYEDGTILQGDKIVDSIDEKTIEKLIKDLGEKDKLCLITDKQSSPVKDIISKLQDKYGADKVRVEDPSEVQGAEYKYTIVDVKYPQLDYDNGVNFNDYFNNLMSKFYTHITRSSDGSIIIKGDNNLPINKSTSYRFPNNSKLSEEDINEYKSIITDVYSNSIGAEIKSDTTTLGGKIPSDKNLAKESEIKEKRIKQDMSNEKTEEFKKNNLFLHARVNHIGLSNNNDGTFSRVAGSNEDLNPVIGDTPLKKQDLFETTAYKGWKKLRRLGLHKNEIDSIPLTEITESGGIYSDWVSLLLDNSNDSDRFKKILKEGQVQIKIAPRTDYDYSLDSPKFNYLEYLKSNGINSQNYARLVYRLTSETGKVYEITLADLPINLYNDELNSVFTSNLTEPVYFSIDTSNIVERGFSIFSTQLDNNGNPVIDDEGNRTNIVDKYGINLLATEKENPDIRISEVYYYTDGIKKGKPFVLVSDSPDIQSEEDMINAYLDGDDYKVMAYDVNTINYGYEDFFTELDRLLKEESTNSEGLFKLTRFVPKSFVTRLVYSLQNLQNILNDDSKIAEYNATIDQRNKENEEFNREAERVGGSIRKRTGLHKIDKSSLVKPLNNILNLFSQHAGFDYNITDIAVLSKSFDNKEIDFDQDIKKWLANKGDPNLLGIDFKDEQWPKFTDSELKKIAKISSQMSILRAFEELKNADSELYKNWEKQGIIQSGESTEKSDLMKKADQAFKFLNSALVGASNLTMEKLLPLIESNLLFYGSKNRNALRFFNNQWKNDVGKEVLTVAMEASGIFHDVWSNSRDSDIKPINGFIRALRGKESHYFYHPLNGRTLYIPNPKVSRIGTQVQQEQQPIVNNVDKVKEEFLRNVEGRINELKTMIPDEYQEAKDKIDEYYNSIVKLINSRKINDNENESIVRSNLKSKISSDLQKKNMIIWTKDPNFISLSFEGESLELKFEPLSKKLLSDKGNNISFKKQLESFPENIEFDRNSNGEPIVEAKEQGKIFTISLTKNGTFTMNASDIPVDNSKIEPKKEEKKQELKKELNETVVQEALGKAGIMSIDKDDMKKILTSSNPIQELIDHAKAVYNGKGRLQSAAERNIKSYLSNNNFINCK